MRTIRQHARRVIECRRTGHPGFAPDRKTYTVGGKPYAFRICTYCGTGVDPEPVIDELWEASRWAYDDPSSVPE